MSVRSVAVVGAGWAGLAAAVRACEAGHRVVLFEMAAHPGGRARSNEHEGEVVDNGQHILIGAYRRTLALMRTVGADVQEVLLRRRFELRFAGGPHLVSGGGPAAPAFALAVLRAQGWRWRDKAALLAACTRWAARGFRCAPALSVATLTRALPEPVRRTLIEPLCVAALNTPADQASAIVFLRVLKDALFSAPGSSDLLLPRAGLSELLPAPAMRWLQARGAEVRLRSRVTRVDARGAAWAVDGEAFDRVIVATPPWEAARLLSALAPSWAIAAGALHYEPIVTVTIDCPGARLPSPMVALPSDDLHAPAQFVFDLGQLGRREGRLAFVVSGAAGWVDAGMPATVRAVVGQAAVQLPRGTWRTGAAGGTMWRCERRATFRCTPGLDRPPGEVAPGLLAAGDYVDGPYPATLEGAVLAGEAAAARC